MFYILLNTVFSTLFFLIPYLFFIGELPNSFLKFGYLFLVSVISGVVGSWIARVLTHYYQNTFKTAQQLYRSFFVAIIYSVLVYIGVVANLFEEYNINLKSVEFFLKLITVDFWEMFAWLMILKLFVFLLSDFLADKISFGG